MLVMTQHRFHNPFSATDMPLTAFWLAPQLMMMRAFQAWAQTMTGHSVCEREARRAIQLQTEHAVSGLLNAQAAMLYHNPWAQDAKSEPDQPIEVAEETSQQAQA